MVAGLQEISHPFWRSTNRTVVDVVQVPTCGSPKRSLTGAKAVCLRWVTLPAVNCASLTPSALKAWALTARKSAGGVATRLRKAAQSPFCHAVKNALSVAWGVEDEPPQAARPSAAASAATAKVNRDMGRSRTSARIRGHAPGIDLPNNLR